MPNLRLKNVAILQSGGTPRVDDPVMWSDDDSTGMPWISIGDMPDGGTALSASRRVSHLGILDRNLPIGKVGTVLFAMYASVGSVAELGIEATWNQAILGMTAEGSRANQRFLYYWLQSLRTSLPYFYRSNTQNNLNAEQVGNLPFTNLSVDQQVLIADYLDAETAKIDVLFAKKQRLIELLDVHLRIEIEDLILTSHTGPSVMIGKLLQLKITDGPHESPEYVDDGIPFLSIEAIKDDRLIFEGCRMISEGAHRNFARKCDPRRNDVLLAKTGATIGKVVIVETDRKFSIWSPLALIRPRIDVLKPKYVWYWLRSQSVQSEIRIKATQSTQPNISMPDIATLRIPVRDLAQQDLIVAKLDELARRSGELCSRLSRQIDLLVQRRQVLITEAVTGQLDIPGVAA